MNDSRQEGEYSHEDKLCVKKNEIKRARVVWDRQTVGRGGKTDGERG